VSVTKQALPALCDAALPRLREGVIRPSYDRSAIRASVLHLGLGAFHRAHQLPLFERLLEQGYSDCGVISAAVHRPDLVDALKAQDGLYTLATPGSAPQVIGAIAQMLVATRDSKALLALIADPAIRLITLTITEKGYAPNGSIPPQLAQGLAARRRAGVAPVTILSCDNLLDNGAFARAAVLARTLAEDAEWIGERCAWPNAMVDRITPRPDPDLSRQLSGQIEAIDACPVLAEAFSQWVIEDVLLPDCPPLVEGGAIVTDDVAAWESLKLRMLNGSHSALAYLGLTTGAKTVRDAFMRDDLRARIEALWNEVAGTVPADLDTDAYRRALAKRFTAEGIAHQLEQIAEDGSVKLPQRIVSPWQQRCRIGQSSPAIAHIVAAWVRFVRDRKAAGSRVIDPNEKEIARWIDDGPEAVLMGLGADADVVPVMAIELARAFT
jgi:fructuronate reductase